MAKQTWKPGNMLYPLPAVMVSVADKDGKPNIFTVAWTGTVCSNPPMVSISVRPERYSYHCIEETGEFVINLTTKELTKAADFCGVRSGRDVDKFAEMNDTVAGTESVGTADRGKPGQPGMPRDAEDRARQPHDVCGGGRFGQCGREVDG